MATTRFHAVFVFLLLALVLATTGCHGTSDGSGHGSGSGLPADRFQAVLASAPPVGYWAPPLAAPLRVTRPFQPPPSPYAAGHRGVDLAGSPGQEVRSAGTGLVTWAGVLAGRGVVVVQHGNLRTTYEPVAAEVAQGSRVFAGDRIGTLQRGHPGCPVTACLHWGVRRGAAYLDPLLLLRPPRVRLLPWP